MISNISPTSQASKWTMTNIRSYQGSVRTLTRIATTVHHTEWTGQQYPGPWVWACQRQRNTHSGSGSCTKYLLPSVPSFQKFPINIPSLVAGRTKVYRWMASLCIGVADGVGQPCDGIAGHVRRTARLAALGGAGLTWFRLVEDVEWHFLANRVQECCYD